MENMKETVERYTSAWNKKSESDIRAEFEAILADGITYEDRNTSMITGIDAFIELVMSSHEKVPGRTFSLLSGPDYFGKHCYYPWTINIPGAGEFEGRDYVTFNDENKMTKIIGFVPNL